MTPIELLAPARDFEGGKAAILAGADALYMGGPRFGARQNAGNSLSDLARMVEFAHFYGAKVYATFNTVILENELKEAEKLIWSVYEAGADALIIQDMGILEMNLPPISLHASTQTHNMDARKIKFLENTGFSRVILARELSLSQITEIHSQTEVELESFVHGALCISQSGQCYLSYALGGRSGNRGECAQPCRDGYTLLDEKGKVLEKDKHLLSLKDLNLSGYLAELLDAGITSFKIEGRLKDVSYALNVTAAYRQALDLLIGKKGLVRASVGKSTYDFTPNLNKTFNRGYTGYFIEGKQENLANFDTPKWQGESLGTVQTVAKNWFSLSNKCVFSSGDGITFLDAAGKLTGTSINGVEGERIFPNSMEGIRSGLEIFRNYDHDFEKQLTGRLPQRKIGVHVEIREESTGFTLTLTDEAGLSVSVSEPLEKNPAQNPEKARGTLEKQLLKMGDSFFYPISFQNKISGDWFFPVSLLNDFRRRALAALEEKRKNSYQSPAPSAIKVVPYFEKELTFEGNVTNSLARQLYEKRGVKVIEPGAEAGANLSGRKLMTLKYCLWYERGQCLKKYPNGSKKLFLQQSRGKVELEIRANCAKCENEVYLRPK